MKSISLIALVCLLFNTITPGGGQEKDKFAKLKQQFADGKYENCAYKAETLTMKESTRRDPEPYLYLAMCNYKIHEAGDKTEEYPKAFDDAFKYAAKTKTKDKTGEVVEKHKDFYTDLKGLGVGRADEFYRSGNYSKSAKMLKKVIKIDNQDHAMLFTKGVFDILSRNVGEGGLCVKESAKELAKANLAGNTVVDPAIEALFTEAMLKYTNYLMDQSLRDSAKSTIALGNQFLGSNSEVKARFEKLNN